MAVNRAIIQQFAETIAIFKTSMQTYQTFSLPNTDRVIILFDYYREFPTKLQQHLLKKQISLTHAPFMNIQLSVRAIPLMLFGKKECGAV